MKTKKFLLVLNLLLTTLIISFIFGTDLIENVLEIKNKYISYFIATSSLFSSIVPFLIFIINGGNPGPGDYLNHIHATVPGRKCPACLAKGQTVWVIPGKCCPQCGTPVNDRSKLEISKQPWLAFLPNLIIMFALAFIASVMTFDLPTFAKESCDAPRAWGIYFQDSASPQMEALVELHNIIMFFLIAILFSVGWVLVSIIKNFVTTIYKPIISDKYLNHGTLIELIWTISPALILILIAFPSFKLLYVTDDVTDPNFSISVEGHQWYWSYQYPDFLKKIAKTFVEYDSYIVPESDLVKGTLRMLEVDNKIVIPEITDTRFIISAGDVIHSFACPSLAIKCDAYPGRLNQASVLLSRIGAFYGQCSEICGVLHSSMPIAIASVSLEKFLYWLDMQ